MTSTYTNAPIAIEDNLVLEMLDYAHAAKLFHLVTVNSEHLSTWLPWVNYMQTVDEFHNYIERCKKQLEEGTDYSYVILLNGAMVGRIGIHFIDRQNRSGSIGYWLAKEWQGKGIIGKACKALVGFCFTELELNRIEIKCGVGNEKSAAIPKRLRFTKEGVLRQAEWVNDKFIDLQLYSILKEEWKM